MSDPAREAVERATNGPVNGPVSMFCLASVLEFAKSIRKLHSRNADSGECNECGIWPCGTAPLIYTTEELE